MDIAAEADEIGDSGSADVYNEKNIGNCDQNEFSQNKAINTVNIAVAMDEAFCFYYEDNLRLLEKCGAKLQYFSPLHDTSLPEDCDAMLLGGGYPELYAKELSKNVSMLNAIKKALEPECRRLQSVEGLCIFTHISVISVMIQMSKIRLMYKTKQIYKMI